MTILMPALAGALLLSAVLRFHRARDRAHPAAAFQSRREGFRLARTRRVWINFLASAGLIWGIAVSGFPPEIPAGVLVLAGLLLESTRTRAHSEVPQLLDFLIAVRKGVMDGLDFFEALRAAAPRLGKLACRRAIEKSLSRHAAGESLSDSLAPLYGAGRLFRTLAADVSSAGIRHSHALFLALDAAQERAAGDWARGRRIRGFRTVLYGAAPWLHPAALGAAAAVAVLSFPLPPAEMALSASAGILLLVALRFPEKFLRAAALAGSLAVVIGVIFAIDPGPVTETGAAEQPAFQAGAPRASFRSSHSRPAPPAPPGVCQISTGVPEGWARLRDGPAMEARVLAYLPEGSLLFRTGVEIGDWEKGAWRQVRTSEGAEGWIYAPLCPDAPAP